MLLLTLPLLALTAFVVRLGGPGPLLHSERHLGADGRTFGLLTFRTISGAPGSSSSAELDGLNRFIYISRIDQLPILFNLVGGDLTLVGPCPQALSAAWMHRVTAPLKPAQKPGLTGWYAAN
jgi:lipopolysaccharide/colanic/teichoic acid biosynthesis glycosyltransferase